MATQETAKIEGPPFPVGEILAVALVTAVVTLLVGALASRHSKRIEHTMETSFENVGLRIGLHPLKTCSLALALTVALGAGFTLKQQETDPANLWVPSGSMVLEHKDYVESAWSSEVFPVFIFGSPGTGSNILTPVNIRALHSHYTGLMQIQVDGDAVVELNQAQQDYASELGGTWTFSGSAATRKLCYEFAPNVCGQSSIFAVFGNNATVIEALDDAAMQAYLAAWDAAPLNSPVAAYPGVFKSFELASVLGGLTKAASGRFEAEVSRTTLFFELDLLPEVRAFAGEDPQPQAPLNALWEADAVCALGLEEAQPVTGAPCTALSDVTYTGFFYRSFQDEFGAAILGDISGVASSYFLITLYLLFMLGKWDTVWSKFSLSAVVIWVVGLSFVASNGICGFLGVKENPLNGNIPFLLLGLGVDDAFVLSSEFARHTLSSPELSIPERIARTAKTGGVSILVTSVTDALAFLIGSTTSLPALSGFCIYAGFGVTFCFIFVMVFFLPWLAIDARRAESNRFDCCCCFAAVQKHELGEPRGLCPCIPGCAKVQPDLALSRGLEGFGNIVVRSSVGRGVTLLAFFALFCIGLSGVGQFEKEFKVEWFFPEGSYFEEFTLLNKKYFGTGESFDVYFNEVDFFAEQNAVNELSNYLEAQEYIVSSSIDNWWGQFKAATPLLYDSMTRESFFVALHDWYLANPRYQSEISWRAAACSAACSPNEASQGVLKAKIRATLVEIDGGKDRFEVYYTYREAMKHMFGDSTGRKVFPYATAFLTWEENGIIDVELIRNLIISCGVIFAIIAALIPYPRVAILVGLNICAAIVEIVGLSHYWGVTMNGVSTIYFLICVGLSVDYSVHIAHTFVDSEGGSEARAVSALGRIGPSTFNAIVSTILAVIVLAPSKSFVFEVFFKILCLVSLIAGAHGLWLLPCLLGLLGGTPKAEAEPSAQHAVAVGKATGVEERADEKPELDEESQVKEEA